MAGSASSAYVRRRRRVRPTPPSEGPRPPFRRRRRSLVVERGFTVRSTADRGSRGFTVTSIGGPRGSPRSPSPRDTAGIAAEMVADCVLHRFSPDSRTGA